MRNKFFPISFRLALCFILILSAAALSGCGDKEPAQRKAFMTFLQKRIIEPAGIILPTLETKERKTFGPYAGHYELLQNFQKKMAADTARNARELLALADLETLDAIAKAKGSVRKAAREAEKLRKSVADLLEKTDKKRAELEQPGDLRAVYAKAYEKIVTVPAQTAEEAFRAIGDMFASTLDLLDFINTHNHDMEISGQSINLRNPGLMDDLTAKMEVVQEKSKVLRQAYAAMMKAILQ